MAINECDVIVVGGGPGGSTAASVTVMDGHRMLLFERETFPRYQIGESLLPATIHGIPPLLGMREEPTARYRTYVAEETCSWEATRVAQHDGSVLEAFTELVGGTSGGDVVPPGGLPPAARTMPSPPRMPGSFATGMEMGIRDMHGDAEAVPQPFSSDDAPLTAADGRRWQPRAVRPAAH